MHQARPDPIGFMTPLVLLLNEIRNAVNKGMALGSERFKSELEALHSRRLRPSKIGRPPKQHEKV